MFFHRDLPALNLCNTVKRSCYLKHLVFAGVLASVAACERNSSEQQIPAQESQASLADATLQQQSTDNSEPALESSSLSESEQLVQDLGFSGAEPSPAEPEPAKSFCLNPTVEQPIEKNSPNCLAIANRLASVSNKICNAAALRPTGCQSVAGFPILVSEFPPLANKQAQGRILVVGGTHGDELTSVSVIFRWVEKLNLYHSGLFHWRLVPMMNPDGVLNRRATRTNKNGVDLNRNMPSDDWADKALDYWNVKADKNPRRFPGEAPASEPETQWLIDEINAFKPDAIISVHAPYGIVDFDSLLLNTAPKNLGKLHLNLLGTYPGSLGNYAGINRNIPVITLELPHAWEMPSKAETTRIWEDIVSWLRANIDNRQPQQTSTLAN